MMLCSRTPGVTAKRPSESQRVSASVACAN
jgi:hypothetical protein